MIRLQRSKGSPEVKVTFVIDEEAAQGHVSVVGSFNGWDGRRHPMRLRQEAGVWARLHRVLLEQLTDAGHLDWSRAALDSASVPAKRGVPKPVRTRRIAVNRARSAMLWSTAVAHRSGSA